MASVVEVPWPGDAEAVFAHLARRRGSVWLDSAGGPQGRARWSVMTAEPAEVLELGPEDAHPLRHIRAALGRCPPPPDGPLPYGPGLYGYLAYDLAPHLEPTATLAARRDVDLPDVWLGRYDAALVLDHPTRRAFLSGAPGVSHDALRNALTDAMCGEPAPEEERVVSLAGPLRTNLSDAAFRDAVRRALDYIAAGDIFQVNLSRRYGAPLAVPPPALYRRLRRANPAPYAAYLGFGGGRAILSSSPELFLDLGLGGRVVTRPIKGTRPRVRGDEAADTRTREDLLASAKDRAELVMIVDLERNDLGRLCSYGTVRVTDPRAVEPYAAVWHTVATIEGRLHAGRDIVDLVRATFPGGSVTGAPKIRAMQIIAELEPTRRCVYTGAIGYLAPPSPSWPAGRAALNIAIRTLLVAAGKVYVQVGGGIVADSEPDAELAETEDKARAMLQALTTASEVTDDR